MKRVLCVFVAVALLAAPTLAQQVSDVDPNWSADKAAASGWGNWMDGETYCGVGIADLGAQTGSLGHLGVEYIAAFDQYYCSESNPGGGVPGPHLVYKFDSMGNLLAGQEFRQIIQTETSPWGYRDMTTDRRFLYGGWEGGIARHNLDGTGGVLMVAGGGPNGNYRALSYDPLGDGGRGSFWTASFGSGLAEVNMAGGLLTNWPNIDGWSLYGLAQDPCDPNMLWGYSSPNQGEVVQIDKTTGRQTGLAYFPNCVPGTATLPGRGGQVGCQIQGGMTGVPGGAFGSGNHWDIVTLGQATSDSLVGNVVYLDDCNSEPGACGPPPVVCTGDLDGDGDTDLADLGILLANFGCEP